MLRRLSRLLLLPAALYAALLITTLFVPSFVYWPDHPTFVLLPWFLFVGAAGLGLAFTQTRIAFCSLLVATAFGVAAFANPRAFLWAGLLLPPSFAVFYRLRERGMWNAYGAARIAVTLLLCGFLALLPQLVSWPSAAVCEPASSWLHLPPAVLVMAVLALPVLLIPKSYESPALGPWMAMALLFVLTALNCRSAGWGDARAPAVLTLFMGGAGFMLLAISVDSAWRRANMDELTQLPARHTLKHRLARLGTAYTVGILDMDHFKRVNDTYGHGVGDQVLRFIASRLQAAAPGNVYRYGGEEFVIVCEGPCTEDHIAAIERARRAVGAEPFRLRGKDRPRRKPQGSAPTESGARARTLTVTMSAGAAAPRTLEDEPLDVLHEADQALYRAKEQGRNRLCRAARR